ncbi:MAG TPA: hypothetical protein VGM03_01625 [Phycisphaerae bacterium]
MKPVISVAESVSIINRNLETLGSGLTASGKVTGRFRDSSGRSHSIGVGFDALLSVIPPKHVRLDVQELGNTVVLFGSNDEVYWLHIARGEDTYRWGHHAAIRDPQQLGLSFRPDQLVEALGLNPLPVGEKSGLMQRAEADVQQLLFVQTDASGRPVLNKEYWLQRREPRLVSRIIFRDRLGRVHMDSRLEDYRAIRPGGPLLPHHVHIEWPLEGGVLDFRAARWRMEPRLTADSPAFVAPHERGKHFRDMILMDPAPPRE